MRWLERFIEYLLPVILILVIPNSTPRLTDIDEKLNILAADQAFDIDTWMLNAVWVKTRQSAIAGGRYMSPAEQKQLVLDYFKLVGVVESLQNEVNQVFSDPKVKDPFTQTASMRHQLGLLQDELAQVAPFAESILENQMTTILQEQGFTLGGQAIPWVSYHVTPLPQYLVVSPRNKIEQTTSYLLDPETSVEQAEKVENHVGQALNVSTLVVEIGGLAAYPTMVMRTTAQDWVIDTIAHEWIHIYVGSKPLGTNYSSDPNVRTMNETTASIAGNELGKMVLERYYPELIVASAPSALKLASLDPRPFLPATEPPPFDFRAEMHETRVTADKLLAEGKIDEAEKYLESRRLVFWQNGYAIRKLNQAYFAFYGAYADVPGGAAGEDPVGPAVRKLREQSATLKEFVDQMAQMDSFEKLQKAIGE
jgi:hypothetical protein